VWPQRARVEFTAAFKAFEEAGNGPKTLGALRCLLLASMLSGSKLNPFDSPDTKAYEREPALGSMAALSAAFLAGDLAAFEPVLRR
jgi:COP9 signalosome complex subunit 2